MLDVALASCSALPEPDFDEPPLMAALASAGLAAEVLAWDDPAADFGRARVTVLRSTWNYPLDRPRFLEWAARTARVSELWNPLPVVEWSSHKRYLLDLAEADLATTPTELVAAGSARRLVDILAARGWREIVVKPAVSAASFRTRRFKRSDLQRGEEHLAALTRAGDALVQEYLPSVASYGERALVWIDGKLTHAVRKRPRFEGDSEFVSRRAVPITSDEEVLARGTLAAAQRLIDAPLLYARVDLAPGVDGRPLLMELELIEPSLFFAQCPAALERFVRALRHRLT